MLDHGARNVHGVAWRSGDQAGRHLRKLGEGKIDEVPGGLVEAALAHVAGNADDLDPLLAVVEGNALPGRIEIVKVAACERLIDDGRNRFAGAVAVVEGSSA